MKKSRIILPAIALLAVSGIASVTGTVAWFTAAQSVTLTATNVAAISTSGDLEVLVKAGVGVNEINITDESSAKKGYLGGSEFKLHNLRDASYDALNSKLYRAVMDSDNTSSVVKGYQEISNGVATTYDSKDVYYAAEWECKFSTKATYGEYDLFFDARNKASSLTGSGDILKAFRVAMVCTTGSGETAQTETIVWAPNGTSTSYVKSTTATDDYAISVFIAGANDSHFNSASTQSNSTAHVTHIARGLTASNPVTVKFVAWFEGTDINCFSDNATNIKKLTAASLSMGFYTVSWTTGA